MLKEAFLGQILLFQCSGSCVTRWWSVAVVWLGTLRSQQVSKGSVWGGDGVVVCGCHLFFIVPCLWLFFLLQLSLSWLLFVVLVVLVIFLLPDLASPLPFPFQAQPIQVLPYKDAFMARSLLFCHLNCRFRGGSSLLIVCCCCGCCCRCRRCCGCLLLFHACDACPTPSMRVDGGGSPSISLAMRRAPLPWL